MKIKRISYESECLTHHLVTKKSRKQRVHTSVKPKTKQTAVQFFEFIHNKNEAFSNNDVLFVCLFLHAALFQSLTQCSVDIDINPPDRLTPNDQDCKLQYKCITVHIYTCPGWVTVAIRWRQAMLKLRSTTNYPHLSPPPKPPQAVLKVPFPTPSPTSQNPCAV